MAVLIDTNVIIDFLTTREPFFEASEKVLTKCSEGEVEGYLAFHSVPNLWYILRKAPEEERRKWLLDLCSFLKVAGANHEEVLKAVRMTEFKDFEDCLQEECAVAEVVDYIVTRNPADFKKSRVKVIEPDDFVRLL